VKNTAEGSAIARTLNADAGGQHLRDRLRYLLVV